MAEYISKEDALKFLAQQADEAQKDADENGGESVIYAECLEDVIADFDRISAADVAPVVRCKDCKYFNKAAPNDKGFCICPASNMEIVPDDFCSYGEKKDGGDG